MKKITQLCVLITLFIGGSVFAQYPNTKINEKNIAYTDSLKQVKYDNIFPIWGQKAYQKGFDIPYPTGAMINYFYVNQGIVIDNLQLGLTTDSQDIPLTDIDFIEFGENNNKTHTVMFRPDVWILPFLNVYGIFGYGTSTTEVNIVAPISLQSVVEQNVSTAGFGVTAAMGVGPVWIALDDNLTWTKPELLDKPVRVNTFGIRLGHNFMFKDKPYRNIGVWVGAMKA